MRPAIDPIVEQRARSTTAGDTEVRVHEVLTGATAGPLCLAVEHELAAGVARLTLNLESVKAMDVLGLAAVHQSVELARLLEVPVAIVPSAEVGRALLVAQLVDELPLAATAARASRSVDVQAPDGARPCLVRGTRVALRQPAWDDLPRFAGWAENPLLERMVGSEFLYRCRHLGAYHPDVVALALGDATSLTALVEPLGTGGTPVGFVRLFNIRLVERFGFLEVAVADARSLHRGWGIEASRLLVAYAMEALGIHRVEAKVYAYNVLSINALRRNGFQQEGVLRRVKTWEGQRWDLLVFSILEDEMAAQRATEDFPPMGFWR